MASDSHTDKLGNKYEYRIIPSNDPLMSRRRTPNPNNIDGTMEETPFTTYNEKPAMISASPVSRSKKKPSCFINALYYFCNFCESTSIHGFKFLGERRRYIIEKIWWLIVVCFAFTGSGTLIYKSYEKWVKSPVIVSFATTETPIWKIPFPAVTICPQTKANPDFFNYTEVYLKYRSKNNITEEEELYYNLFSLVCDAGTNYVNETHTETISNSQLMYLVLSFSGVNAENCKWLGDEYTCSDVLSYTLTTEGWCVTFNMLDHEEVFINTPEVIENKKQQSTNADKWSLEGGYPTDDMDAYPRRTMLAGAKSGFQLDLLANEDELDYLCSDLQGFKVTLHHPTEAPNMDQYFLVPLNHAVLANIKPKMITTADDIRQYTIKDRECFLDGEYSLHSFKSYTQNNCMAECLRNYTEMLCGCVGFHMAFSDSNVTFCGASNKECMNLVKVRLLELEKHVKNASSSDDHNSLGICNCLPSCTSIDYDVETTQSDWKWRKTYQFRNVIFESDFDPKKDHMARLVVYYGDLQFLTSERHELTGLVDFLASCGGLLGLFCGFSVTSSIEILYYLSLRLICNLKKFGRKVWSGDQDLIDTNAK